MICIDCNKKSKAGAKFCNWCGVRLGNDGIPTASLVHQNPTLVAQHAANEDVKTCPFCAEPIKFTAIKCKHCGSMLTVRKQSGLQGRVSSATNTWNRANQLDSQEDERNIALFSMEFDKRKKKSAIAYLLWLLLGGVGGHKFYTGQPGWGLTYVVVTLGLTPFILTFIPLIVIGLILLVDMFTLPGQVADCNNKIRQELMLRYRLI